MGPDPAPVDSPAGLGKSLLNPARVTDTVESATLVIAVVIALGTLGAMWLPMRKAWNADGSDDRRRDRHDEEE